MLGSIVDSKAKVKRSKHKTEVKIKTEPENVLEKNRKLFEHYDNLIQIAGTKTADVEVLAHEEEENKIQIGALTNFDALEEEEEEDQVKNDNKDILGETEGLTVEELEQRRLEEFRVNKKEEMDTLTSEMNDLKDKLSKIKKEALVTQTDVEDKRKQLEQEQ